MQKPLARIIYGALGGASGAACMTVIRMIAHRNKAIGKTVAQSMEEWVASRSGLAALREPVVHHVADQIMHYGYGSMLGGLYGLLLGRRRARNGVEWVARGGGFGLATWVLGSWVLLPALGAKSSPSRQGLGPLGVDLAAHVVFGIATALMCDELGSQRDHVPTPDSLRALASVG